ncbi:MAG: ATP-binding protein [Actinomycetota bacterium]|nr:ATP-binding protein [Actinomycetota bacterium]MDQ3640880.1 ATP-binding protein [Actinomycetota bacterium]
MAIWRSPELEAIFDGPLDTTGITEAAVQRVVGDQTPESEVLDFKQALWAKSPRPRPPWTEEQEFAKDVGALANHRGGVLLVGVTEVGGVAKSAAPFAIATSAEAEERRLRQALVNTLAPLATTEFIWIPTATGAWFCAVVVPRSPRAPHAVVIEGGTGLRYPVRHGADTAWLSEAEVAERYRRRILAQTDDVERVHRVVSHGREALRHVSGVWLFATAIPELPVEGALDQRTVETFEDWHRSSLQVSPLDRSLPAYGRGIPAPGKVTFTGSLRTVDEDETEVRDAYVELHVDGSALAASPVGFNTSEESNRDVGELTLVDDGVLVIDLVLRWCAHRVGAWGTATIVVGLVDCDGEDAEPIRLVFAEGGPVRRRRGTRALSDPLMATTVADLAAVSSLQQRLTVTHAALSGLLQWFGVAEPPQILRDGTIVPQQFTMSRYRQVERWAADHGVLAKLLPSR